MLAQFDTNKFDRIYRCQGIRICEYRWWFDSRSNARCEKTSQISNEQQDSRLDLKMIYQSKVSSNRR